MKGEKYIIQRKKIQPKGKIMKAGRVSEDLKYRYNALDYLFWVTGNGETKGLFVGQIGRKQRYSKPE